MAKTPNLNLNVPDYQDSRWDIPVNENWSLIDGAVAGKQATLVSGTNIKTINGISVLGNGDISVGGSDVEAFTAAEVQTIWNGVS